MTTGRRVRKATKKLRSPAVELAMAFQSAYDHFNAELFDGELPQCMITPEPMRKAFGFFRVDGWKHRGIKMHTIGMNPSYLDRDPRAYLSTLVHEMVHLEHEIEGTAPKGAYHNRRFAQLMEEVGLICSDTGQPGGKKTGNSMSHYVVHDGPFDQAYRDLIAKGWSLDSKSLVKELALERIAGLSAGGDTTQGKRQKYYCPKCGLKAWARFGANLSCGDDSEVMMPSES